jgi:hypothetical protein
VYCVGSGEKTSNGQMPRSESNPGGSRYTSVVYLRYVHYTTYTSVVYRCERSLVYTTLPYTREGSLEWDAPRDGKAGSVKGGQNSVEQTWKQKKLCRSFRNKHLTDAAQRTRTRPRGLQRDGS